MNYQLNTRQHNKQAHVDIERELDLRKNGQFTFTLKVNGGNIMDCQIMESADIRNYLQLKSVTIQEITIKHG